MVFMRVLMLLGLALVLIACSTNAVQPTPYAIAPTVQARPTAESTAVVRIDSVSAPAIAPVADRLEWTEAAVTLALRNDDAAPHQAEVIIWFKVQPPGLHGPGWGKRTAYKRVQITAAPNLRTATNIVIREVHAGSSVTIDRSYIRQIDGTVIDSRALDPAFEE